MVYNLVITAARSDNPEAVLTVEGMVLECDAAAFCAGNAILAKAIAKLDAAAAGVKKTAQAEVSPELVQ